ncbi:hypothetical protein HYW76_00930 [Candidatus Pacearchaeota archaeon]|nr:hypothetical protein [Candidatus Pacearchaeota archaeon]
MKILFVCKHNRFRSKVAEAIFDKLNNKDIEVKSAGIKMDELRKYVAENVHKIMKEKGYKIKDEVSRVADKNVIDWADKIVIVANDVGVETFPRDKTEVWVTEDADEKDYDTIKKIIEKIEERVKKLVLEL